MAEPKALVVKVNVPEDKRVAVHANVVNITTTSRGEVMFDFAFVHPNDKEGETQRGTLVARVVVPTSLGKEIALILNAHLGGKPKGE